MIPEGATRLFDQQTVAAAYDELAAKLNADLPQTEVLLLPVMTGGMFTACELAPRIRRRQRMDYVHASRYRGKTRGAAIEWLHWPSLPKSVDVVILIDDIFDEGHTMDAVARRLVDDGADEVVTVAMALKQHERGLPRNRVDDAAFEVPDRYVFGCGMDWKGLWRQLDGVWAIGDSA